MNNIKLFNWPVYFIVLVAIVRIKKKVKVNNILFRERIDNTRYNLTN
jgi:hypothetical protein